MRPLVAAGLMALALSAVACADGAGSVGAAGDPRPWPGGVVRYAFAPDLDDVRRAAVREAMGRWEAATLVRFAERDADTPHWVEIRGGAGCAAATGYQDFATPQPMVVGPGCGGGHLLHELGHVIGLPHEHTRPDRDAWVVVHDANVPADRADDLDVDAGGLWAMGDPGPYDLASIMHYDSYAAWAVDPDVPILSRADCGGARCEITAQRERLTDLDRRKANLAVTGVRDDLVVVVHEETGLCLGLAADVEPGEPLALVPCEDAAARWFRIGAAFEERLVHDVTRACLAPPASGRVATTRVCSWQMALAVAVVDVAGAVEVQVGERCLHGEAGEAPLLRACGADVAARRWAVVGLSEIDAGG